MAQILLVPLVRSKISSNFSNLTKLKVKSPHFAQSRIYNGDSLRNMPHTLVGWLGEAAVKSFKSHLH